MRRTVKQRREQRRQNMRDAQKKCFDYFFRQMVQRGMEYIRDTPTPFLDALRKSPAPTMMIDAGQLVPIGPSPIENAIEVQRQWNEVVRLSQRHFMLSMPSEEEMEQTRLAVVLEDLKRKFNVEMMRQAVGSWENAKPSNLSLTDIDKLFAKPTSLDTMPE